MSLRGSCPGVFGLFPNILEFSARDAVNRELNTQYSIKESWESSCCDVPNAPNHIGCTDSTQKDLWDASFSSSRVDSFLQISLNSIINVTNLCWWKRRWQLRNTKSSVLQRKHTYGLRIRPTQPLMTLMLNNEWQGKYTHQRPPAIIFLSIWKQKKKKKKRWPEKTLASLKTSDSIEWLRVTVNHVVTVETVTAAPDVHSRWLRGSSRRPWCSASGSSPPGRRRGWARTRPAASPSRWWISSSSSWRSLRGDTFGNVSRIVYTYY